jgi:hypothetical protein
MRDEFEFDGKMVSEGTDEDELLELEEGTEEEVADEDDEDDEDEV